MMTTTRNILVVCLFLNTICSHNIFGQEITSFPHTENFDSATDGDPGILPTNWQQVDEGIDDTCAGSGATNCDDWTVNSGGTNTTSSGPLYDHTTGDGNYIYVEASGNDNDSVIVLSPSFDLNGDTDIDLKFWAHHWNGYNTNDNYLYIDIVNEANTTHLGRALLTIESSGDRFWKQYTVDLSPYASSGEIRVKFRWEEGSANYRLDIAIDDFELTTDYCADSESENYKDEFASATYNNTNGSIDWSGTSWTETDDDGSPTTGNIDINAGRVEFANPDYDLGDQPSITRDVDLGNVKEAMITVQYSSAGDLEDDDEWSVDVYDGTTWHTVMTISGIIGGSTRTATIDITQYADADSRVRVGIKEFFGGTGERLRIHEFEICYIPGDPIVDFFLEAECAYTGSSWFQDTSSSASNLNYVQPKDGLASLASAPADTSAYLTFVVDSDTATNYNVWGRVIATSDTTDSYWIRVNDGTWYKWDSLSVNSTWAWEQAEDSDADTILTLPFINGTNRVDIAYREDGVQLDKIFFTASDSIPSGTGGAATNCPMLFGTDTDGDGIVDDDDLDDDNDGILDVDESPATIDFSGTKTILVGGPITNMGVGDVVMYSDAVRDCNDVLYDITIEVTAISPGVTVEAGAQGMEIDNASAADDDHFEFTLNVVESGSATASNPGGTPATITDFLFTPRDIDSNDGIDHTEVIGVSTSTPPDAVSFDDNTVLEVGGFINGSGPGTGYTYYRMIPLDGPTDWTSNGNDGSGTLPEHAVFLLYNNFSSVDIAFGRTGSAGSGSGGNRLTSLFASKECDRDGDGVPNRIDLDLDNDGIFDLHEAGHSELDLNDDGRIDSADVYSGANGIFDDIETTPESGILNYTYSDSDASGIEDPFDRDSDDDGCFDTEEADVPDPDVDGVAGSGTPAVDINGLVISIVYDIPPTTAWQDSLLSCLEICDNGLDDDGDGKIDEDDEDCANYYLEAECGFPGDNWDRGFDLLASNNDYLTISPGLNSTETPPTAAADLVRFTVTVTAAGLYRILGRVYSDTGADDSFWVRVDEGTWYRWNDWNTAATWQWLDVTDNDNGNTLIKWNLTTGNHTIDIAYSEDGARIDKLHLTINGTTPTGEGEDAINCGRTITYNLFLPYKILNK